MLALTPIRTASWRVRGMNASGPGNGEC